MRYVAKIHVLDVLEKVVVSGYVLDTDPLSNPDHETYEFSVDTAGLGMDDPLIWLVTTLQRCLLEMTKPADSQRRRA
jgi:hypothetical protein